MYFYMPCVQNGMFISWFTVYGMYRAEACISAKVESFPVEKSLFAERVKVNEVFSLSKMMYKGDYLFVSDARSNENLIHQYSLPDFKCVYEGGSKGQAEDEFQIFPVFCNTPADKVYIWGYTMFSIRSFTLDNAGQLTFERKYDLPISGDMYNDIHVVRDSILVMNEVSQLAIKKINLNNQQIIGEIKFKKDEHNESFFCENSGYMAANDSLIVYAYRYKKQIDIYDMGDMKLKKNWLAMRLLHTLFYMIRRVPYIEIMGYLPAKITFMYGVREMGSQEWM